MKNPKSTQIHSILNYFLIRIKVEDDKYAYFESISCISNKVPW